MWVHASKNYQLPLVHQLENLIYDTNINFRMKITKKI